MKTVYFVTTNSSKYRSYADFLRKQSILLKQHKKELVEPQSSSTLEIVRNKLEQAKSMLPGKRVLVDDRGFEILALNNFPGPLLKPVLGTIGADGLLSLMANQEQREANFVTAIGYFNGHEEHFHQYEEEGFVHPHKTTGDLRGWTELLYIWGHNMFPGKTLAQLTDAEWQTYLNETREDRMLEGVVL